MWFMFVFPFIMFFIIFTAVVFNMIRVHKASGDSVKKIINTVSAYAEQQEAKEIKPVEPQTKTCEYCGASIDAKAMKCDSCGAKAKK